MLGALELHQQPRRRRDLRGEDRGLAGPGDKALFSLMRELADVIVVGAGTVRVENYGGAQMSAAARQARRDQGQSEVPPIAIVTQSGLLDRDMFTHTEVPPLVLTTAAAQEAVRGRLGGSADVVACSGEDSAESTSRRCWRCWPSVDCPGCSPRAAPACTARSSTTGFSTSCA